MTAFTTCPASKFSTRAVGAKFTNDYRVYLENAQGQVISPFHDVPLWASKEKHVAHMVCEIPRWSNAKLEISKDEFMNPIKQDIKKGALRFVKNCFPNHGYMWNYGALPQTWECPAELDSETGLKGDNDPIDAVEIGSSIATIGEVKQVKILGCLALLDEGETDWKVIVLDIADPLAARVNSLEDVEAECPGFLSATRHWFRTYKVPDGKPPNEFAFKGEFKDRDFAIKIIERAQQSWSQLIAGKIPKKTADYNIETANRLEDSPHKVADADEQKMPPKNAAKPDHCLDHSVDAWSFLPANL